MGRRLLAAVVALTAAVPLLALTGSGPALAAEAPAVTARGGAAGADYATNVFGDPWDYSNTDDLLLDGNGPTIGLSNQRMADGLVRAEVTGAGYVSPVWSGYQGALLLGRDGSAAGQAVDAGRYRTVSFSAWSSRDISAGLMWFACPGGGVSDQCGGGYPFTLKEGWNTYVIRPTTSAYANGSSWTRRYEGQLTGLRLALSPGATSGFALDWMRVSQPDSGAQVSWQNPSPGSAAELVWDRNGDRSDNVPGQPGWGVVASTSAASATADLSVLPAGDYRLVVRSRGTWGPELRVPLDAPIAVLTNPDEDGDRDFATDVLGDPWDMANPSDVDKIYNSTNIEFANGRLAATNDLRSALPNDPHMYLRTGPGIDSRVYNRLTLTTSYDGPFDLRDVAGGGTMGRVTWRRADLGDTVMQTKDILTYTGRRTVTIDMSQPAMDLTDEATTNRYAFVSGSPVTQFRWDPNEDRGARRWYVYNISLKSDFVARRGFPVRWYDAAWRPGGTATVVADTDRTGCDGRRIATGQPVQRGGNSTPWEVDGTPAGTYWLCVRITRGNAVTEQYAKAPVVVKADAPPGPPPAAPALPDVAATAAGATVQWSPPASPGSQIAGYQVRDTVSGEARTVGELDPGITWTGLPAGRDASFQVRALNDAGWGEWSAATAPVRPAVPQDSRFVPREPVRLLAGRVSAGAPLTLPLRGVAGVPDSATAVALNVTSTRALGDGAVSVYPTGSTSGTRTSSLNVKEGTDRPNAVTAKLSASGSVTLSINAGASDVLVDLFGWYVPSGGLGFHPATPTRVLDTRDGTGVPAGALGPRGQALLRVSGVPRDAQAAVLNTTAAGVVGGGFVSVFPPGQPDGRTTSALNTRDGVDVANLVTTALDPYGQVQLYNDAGSAQLIGDLAGWYDPAPDGLALTPVAPWRVLDTRIGLGAPPGRIEGGQTRVLDLAGGELSSGVPAGARAVVLNLTATEVEAPGTYLSVYPTGSAAGPATSSLNLPGGDTRPNLVVALLAADGTVEIYNNSGATQVIADVVGYFA